MAVLRSTQFAIGVNAGTTVNNIYTVPTGHRIILHSIQLQELSGVACSVQVREATIGTWATINLTATPATGSSAQVPMYIVFGPGQIIQLKRSNAGNVNYILSGTYLFI